MKKNKHILVISQYFFPENFRINDICKEWVHKGYKVTVVTGIPNYPEGEFFSGYSFTKRRTERYHGIDIIRLPIIPRGTSKISLILNYLSFVASGYIWSVFSKLKPDNVFIFEVSPMTQALPGVWFAKKKKIPCHIYVQDLWPENVEIVTGIKSKRILEPIGRMVDYIYSNCDRIFTTSHSFANSILNRGVQKNKVFYWPQYSEELQINIKHKKKVKEELSVVFTGNIGEAQGLEQLVPLSQKLKQLGYEDRVHFTLVGEGRFKNYLIKMIADKKLTAMFTFTGRVSADKVPTILRSHDIALLSLSPNPLFDKTIPAKLQTYLSVGMPIFGLVNGEAKKSIEESKTGLVANHGDIDKQVHLILSFLGKAEAEMIEYRNNGMVYSDIHFNKDKLMDVMDKHLNNQPLEESGEMKKENIYV
ncbi:glycosyltransferase family 4 protein [Exiguobacterium aurantiacum]|uniref:glycosyltransferase family 4 protein n=1 Tax=Exiguobacterium aurantiacum TaxID=33987 RepID=UPI0008779CE6|nr:glycosyltransferase family 4 protein [Exiguobacterium aurantiacum]